MAELTARRGYKHKVFANGDGTETLRTGLGHQHYKNGETFEEVDLTLEDMGTYWRMQKASYRLFIAKDFGANQLIRYDNRFEGANHTIYYEPKQLRWVNKTDLTDSQVFRTAQSVQGEVNGRVIRYTDAFGDGIHFEITLRTDGFTKEVVIDARNKLEQPPTPQHKLVALFRYQGDGLKVLKRSREEWDEDSYFEASDGFRIEETTGKPSFIRPTRILDSSDSITARGDEQQSIPVFWRKFNGSLWQAKVLPTQFLMNATYPVRADTTTTFDIQDTNDDGHDYEGLIFHLDRNIIIIGGDGGYIVNASFRFESIGIAQGTTIDSAYLKLSTQAASLGEGSGLEVDITANDADDVSPSALRPSTNTPTTASVAWGSISLAQGVVITSPDIASVVQEVVDRAGWSSGNAINIWVNGQSTTRQYRRIVDYSMDGTNTAQLEITYTTGGGGPTTAAARRAIFFGV